MKLNEELFWKLCEEYEVPFSSEYSTLMLKEEDGTLHEFTDDDILKIFLA